MSNRNLIILGCSRNNEQYISHIQTLLQSIIQYFKSYEIHIAHNDSTDRTLSLLTAWETSDVNCHIYDFTNLITKIPSRTQRLAYCRNFLLSKVIRSCKNWLLVLDMDNVNMTFKGFENVFRVEKKWAALFINQAGPYYDIWALRTKEMNWDCWEKIRNAVRTGVAYKVAKEYYVGKYQYKIDPSAPVMSVYSAFGGAGLYKTKYLNECEYIGFTNGNECCEHVSFHSGIRKNGGELYILPSWLNATPSEHV